jgi:hypothetical protein
VVITCGRADACGGRAGDVAGSDGAVRLSVRYRSAALIIVGRSCCSVSTRRRWRKPDDRFSAVHHGLAMLAVAIVKQKLDKRVTGPSFRDRPMPIGSASASRRCAASSLPSSASIRWRR